MTLLFLISEVIARTVDRRRGRVSYAAFDDEETSPIEAPDDVRRSRLDPDED